MQIINYGHVIYFMRRIIIVFVVIVVSVMTIYLVINFPIGSQKIDLEIEDLSKRFRSRAITTIPTGKDVYKVKVEVKGYTQEDFKINGILIEAGKIDIVIKDGDYYSPDYLIEYEPLTNKEGKLVVSVVYFYS